MRVLRYKKKEYSEFKTRYSITIPANVKYWYGVKNDSYFRHIVIKVPGENTSNEWCESARRIC
ncbi:hypothetical protein EGP98_03185 [bacterium]|nr:hypothetical protein [bacterium]